MIIQNKRSLWRDRRGSAAVEFAFIVPAIIVIMFGIMEMGRYFLAYSSISSATVQLSRYVMIDPDATSTTLKSQFEQYLHSVDPNDVTISFSTETDAGLTFQVVDVSVPHDTVIPFVPLGTFTIQSRVRTPLPSS